MDLEEQMIDYVNKVMTKEVIEDPECDSILIGAMAAVVFYTDRWRFLESKGDGSSLADKAGIAITDSFTCSVLQEQAEHDDDFESFREKYPVPDFIF